MNILSYIKRKSNLPSIWLSAGTVLAGTGASVVTGNMEVLPATICLIFAVFAQLWANLYHSASELRREEKSFVRNSISYAPEEAVGKEEISFRYRVCKEAAMASFIISALAGLALLPIANQWIWFLLCGIFIYGQVWVLQAGKKPLINTPVSMLMTFIVFGPVGVMSTSLIQSQREAVGSIWALFDMAPSLFLGPAAGLMALTVHYIFSYVNYCTAPGSNPRNLTYLLRPSGMEIMIFINGLLMLGLMLWMVFALHLEFPLLVVAPAFVGFALNTHIAVELHRRKTDFRFIYNLSLTNYVLTFVLTFIMLVIVALPSDTRFSLF